MGRSSLPVLSPFSLTPHWSPTVGGGGSPTLYSSEHLVVHGFEGPCGRHGGEPCAEEPERGSRHGNCGGREEEGAHGAARRTPRLSPARDARALGSRVGKRQMRLRGPGAEPPGTPGGNRPPAGAADLGPRPARWWDPAGFPGRTGSHCGALFSTFVNKSPRLCPCVSSSVPNT